MASSTGTRVRRLQESDAARDPREARARQRFEQREERKRERAERGERPRLEEATSVGEAVEASYEEGRAAGLKEGGSSRPTTTSSSSSSAGGGFSVSNVGGGSLKIGAPLAVETLIITADELVNKGRLPVPSRLLIAWALFAGLGMFPGRAQNTGAAIGWGLVVATFYSTVAPGTNALKAIGDFIGGKAAGSTFGTTGATGAGGGQGFAPIATGEAGPLVGGPPSRPTGPGAVNRGPY